MRSWLLSLALASVLILPAAPGAAQSTGAANLRIPPDVRAEGMGRVWAPLTTGPYAAWGNVGGLGLLEGVQVVRMHSQLVPDLADDVNFDYTSIVAGYTPLRLLVPLNFSVGYNRTNLDYGTSIVTNPDSPDPIGTFESGEHTDGFTLALGVGGVAGFGVGFKRTNVNLGPYGTGKSSMRDFGVLIRSPYLVFGDNYSGEVAVRWTASGPAALRLLIGRAWSNDGDPIALTPARPGDPLPELRRDGIGFELELLPLSRYVTPESRFWKRVTRDAHAVTISAAVGRDDDLWPRAVPDSIAVFLSKNELEGIRTYRGVEIRAFDILSFRRGRIVDAPGRIKGTTTGWGISFLGYAGIDYASIPQYKDLDQVKKWSFWLRVPLDGW